MKRWSALFLLLIVLALAGCGLVSTGESAADNAAQIAAFEVPPGFTPVMGMDLAGMVMVGYTNAAENGHIYLIQAPESANMSQDQLEQSLRDALQSSQGVSEATEVEEVPVTIRGQDVTATVGTTTGQNETVLRVMTVPFTGQGGPALLLVQIPEAEWDQAAIDDFIASFR